VREFAFELSLSAHLERTWNAVVSRQLGASVEGRRILDTLVVEPGPGFPARAAITPERIPPPAIESDVGVGRARYWKAAFDCHPDRARSVVDWAVDVGFFERDRRSGREYVRQTARYPDEWFNRIVGIENKPDLDRPGDLETQLLTDVELGLVDEVVLATASHVTGAHRNRIPEAVGIWRFDPETGEREVLRTAEQLATDDYGVEIVDRGPARTEVSVVAPDQKARARRRLAERAYGKGWRPEMPACSRVDPDADGLPYCPWKGRLVHAGSDCGQDCDGHDPAEPPAVEAESLRGERTPWEPDPEGRERRQAGLDRFS